MKKTYVQKSNNNNHLMADLHKNEKLLSFGRIIDDIRKRC